MGQGIRPQHITHWQNWATNTHHVSSPTVPSRQKLGLSRSMRIRNILPKPERIAQVGCTTLPFIILPKYYPTFWNRRNPRPTNLTAGYCLYACIQQISQFIDSHDFVKTVFAASLRDPATLWALPTLPLHLTSTTAACPIRQNGKGGGVHERGDRNRTKAG